MKFITLTAVIASSAVTAMSLTSCVDNDYDLSKDVDLNVTVGGNITLPPSSTDRYTVEKILDLDGNSSIKPEGENYGLAKGDYVLVAEGTTSSSGFRIGEVELPQTNGNSESIELPFVGVGTNVSATSTVKNLTNTLNINSSNVDRQLVAISEAEVDMTVDVSLDFSAMSGNNSVTIGSGFTIDFPDGWYVRNAAGNADITVENNNVVKFVRNRTVQSGSPYTLSVNVYKINVNEAGPDQGLNNGRFSLVSNIVSNGTISLNSQLAAGATANVKLTVTPVVRAAQIRKITARVNPDITVNASSFEITGIPDFLKEPGSKLDIANPRINLSITNTSPLEVNINGKLRAVTSDGTVTTVPVGDMNGTDPIFVKGNGTTEICISTLGTGGNPGAVNVKVPNLSKLINTIPDRIEMTEITARVPQTRDYTLELGPTYDFDVDYNAVVPLAFGPDLRFTYTTSDEGWEEELDKYNFNQVVATLKVDNTSPLCLKPTIKALDINGNEINDVTARIDGDIKAGSLGSPSISDLTITITSNAGNIGRLGGVLFTFDVTSSPDRVGVPLNIGQALQFNDIVLRLKGGVDIDLN